MTFGRDITSTYGITQDAYGIAIDPGAPYTIEEAPEGTYVYRAGLPRPRSAVPQLPRQGQLSLTRQLDRAGRAAVPGDDQDGGDEGGGAVPYVLGIE
jgi:hypothetical protein